MNVQRRKKAEKGKKLGEIYICSYKKKCYDNKVSSWGGGREGG